MEDIYNRKYWYGAELKRLKNSAISTKNKELIKAYHDHLFSEDSSEPRVIKLSWQLRRLAELFNKDFDKTTEEDVRRVIAQINKSETLAEASKADYRRIMKQVYKWLEGHGKAMPDKVAWIKVKAKQNGKETIDIITTTEINKVIEVCENERDKAFISLLYEGGFRIAEILNMKIRDFENNDHHGKVRVTGKTGPRNVFIVSSIPYLNRYLSVHPFRNDLNSYFWLSLGTYRHNERLMYIGAKKLVQRAFKQAEIKKKRLYLHLFRHSRATELASHLTEAQMKHYFGWAKSSDMPAVYVHLSGRDVDEGIRSYYGIQTNKEDKKDKLTGTVSCPRCNTINASNGKYCADCGLALNAKVAMETETSTKEETNKTFKVLMEIMENPQMRKEFEAFRAKML